MPHYYFDLRHGDTFVVDEDGLELENIEVVQEEATRALAGLASDAVRNFAHAPSHRITIEVRDHLGAVMQVRCVFEVVRKQ
jgi:hypothetical protein